MGERWLTFNAVGAVGAVVQTAALWCLVEQAGAHYLQASALAIELAILVNFALHRRWTWRDRTVGLRRQLVRYNLLHGATAILNLACLAWLVERAGMAYLPAGILSVATCSLVNFTISHGAVFVTPPFDDMSGRQPGGRPVLSAVLLVAVMSDWSFTTSGRAMTRRTRTPPCSSWVR